jgi:hypothetical protein
MPPSIRCVAEYTCPNHRACFIVFFAPVFEVNPVADDHIESCVQPCPVQAYTDEEYTWMWALSNSIGLVGFGLNSFMACTWIVAGGKKCLSSQPYQLKFCVIAGLLFGVIATLPSLALKYDLPCECATEEWCVLFHLWFRVSRF